MSFQSKPSRLIILLLATITILPSQNFAERKTKNTTPRATPVLWREPADITSRNLYLGPGGSAMRPDLKRVTFIKEEKGGYSTKYRVRDASGRIWIAKIGKEAQSETAATRLLWAVGYQTEISYLVPRVNIIGKGAFENVRFEARPKGVKRLDEWEWDKNPFIGTKQFQGLKVMMVLLNNWDIKDSNNKVLLVRNRAAGRNELRYIVSDLGATLGKTGSFLTRSRNKPKDFVKAEFIDELDKDLVDFHYSGKRKGIFEGITVGQARWIGSWLARLSDSQIRDAFRAANYNPEEVRAMSQAVRERINELMSLSR